MMRRNKVNRKPGQGRRKSSSASSSGSVSGSGDAIPHAGYEDINAVDPFGSATAAGSSGDQGGEPGWEMPGREEFFHALIGSEEKQLPTLEETIEESTESSEDESSEEDDPVANLTGVLNMSADATDTSTAALSILTSKITTLTKQVTKLKHTKSKKRSPRTGDAEKHRLSKIPSDSGQHGLPTARSWHGWLRTKLRPWAALAATGFDGHVLNGIFRGHAEPLAPPSMSERQKKGYLKANRVLALEIGNAMNETLSLFLTDVNTTNGYSLLFRIHKMVTQYSVEKTAALNKRFQNPTPVKKNEELTLGLVNWRMDFVELHNMMATPDKATTLSSLKKLTGELKDLETVTEMIELTTPGDPRPLFVAEESPPRPPVRCSPHRPPSSFHPRAYIICSYD